MSRTSVSPSSSSFSPLSSPSSDFCCLAAAFAVCSGDALKSACFFCHSAHNFFHAFNFSLNHSEGCKSSNRVTFFLARTLLWRYSFAAASSCHKYLMLSNPSDCCGSVKLAKHWSNTVLLRSDCCFVLNHVFFSSSVNSTFGGSAGSSSSSLVSIVASASAGSSFTSSFFSSLDSSLTSPSAFVTSEAPSSFFVSESTCIFVLSSDSLLAPSAFFFAASSIFFLCSSMTFCRFAISFFLALST
mmetsp:Transcript_103757/g.300083  ORF Transcript_103757/g.300083 Transcript_103757/m.300083 type:complete len:243 (+) Transcript_103757:672-1400(+)